MLAWTLVFACSVLVALADDGAVDYVRFTLAGLTGSTPQASEQADVYFKVSVVDVPRQLCLDNVVLWRALSCLSCGCSVHFLCLRATSSVHINMAPGLG